MGGRGLSRLIGESGWGGGNWIECLRINIGLKTERQSNSLAPVLFTRCSCFVVKTRFAPATGMKIKNSNGVDATGKLFVNICSHEGVQRPLNSEGQPVAEDR